jgi:hypothetical protein
MRTTTTLLPLIAALTTTTLAQSLNLHEDHLYARDLASLELEARSAEAAGYYEDSLADLHARAAALEAVLNTRAIEQERDLAQLWRRDAEAEAEADYDYDYGLYARDADAEAEAEYDPFSYGSIYARDAEPEANYDYDYGIYARDADADAEFEESLLHARAAALEDVLAARATEEDLGFLWRRSAEANADAEADAEADADYDYAEIYARNAVAEAELEEAARLATMGIARRAGEEEWFVSE